MNQPVESNVIPFPKPKRDVYTEVPDIDSVISNIDAQREDKINDMSEVLATILLEQLSATGFPINYDPKYIKDMCFCLESLKALLYKYYNIEHPFHNFADACFNIEEDGVEFTAPIFKLMKEEGE